RIVNAAHKVSLPDSGTGNQVPESSGAGLVVIYRDASMPLTGIVLYEGFNFTPVSSDLSQTLRGFFQRAPGAVGKLTQFVSSGQPNTTEQISFNGVVQPLSDPFNSSPSSQRGYRALTLSNLSMGGTVDNLTYGDEVTTTTTHGDSSAEECLAWSAFVFSVPVQDTDRDGLLNIWESDRVANLKDPDDTPLPNLYAMRARPNVTDIFLDNGYMYAPAGTTTTYGHAAGGVCESPACEQDTDGHSHLPAKEALDMVATAFRNAYGSGAQEQPRAGGVTGPINIHFDVGNN